MPHRKPCTPAPAVPTRPNILVRFMRIVWSLWKHT
jgi:hypothetical protein